MRILIAGAGIAGPTLAYWLLHYGFTPTLVESAPRVRTGGYIIDFWGAGFDIAERMHVLPALEPLGYKVQEMRVLNDSGRCIARLPTSAFFELTQGRFLSLARGDLADCLYKALEGRVEALFGDRIARVTPSHQDVTVSFQSGSTRTFDLVIGTDGLHSGVRQMAFGDEARFEKYLGCKAAAFQVAGYVPRDELVYVMHTEVGQQVARFSMRDDRTMFLLTFKDQDPAIPATLAEQKALLRRRFGGSGWEVPQILEALDGVTELYIDRVSQIRMGTATRSWSRERMALAGDSAFCVSLLAGQGSALAMVAAYILAGELSRSPEDSAAAFARYQQRFGPFVLGKQKAAPRMVDFFAPRSRVALALRNGALRLMSRPWIASLAVGRSLYDRIEIPDYEAARLPF
ncbi:MAG TPA: FAD-binding domain [Acidobacteriaceae bacterium]|jgi:2-polyprenyl-6-methoxyphenol hydroxylase-like FAD-dependent oxidoreductase|nr:FAD-binding domain [Acidobacteriaceae bacterium]